MEIGTTKLFHIIIRVPKHDSAFFYFLLESHEGLAFYSTLPHDVGQGFRDIDMKGSVELINALEHLIDGFCKVSPDSKIIQRSEVFD
ncbi:MAG: DUF4911 domain-containing protein [Bdellovibrionales bacterium]|jgi:hypothetical protein|nr:DUF4911 domain-containing protein [Bdellovibrionales bacterium]